MTEKKAKLSLKASFILGLSLGIAVLLPLLYLISEPQIVYRDKVPDEVWIFNEQGLFIAVDLPTRTWFASGNFSDLFQWILETANGERRLLNFRQNFYFFPNGTYKVTPKGGA